jgi:hypothetical protein
MSNSHKGHKGYWTGKKMLDETKLKIKNSMLKYKSKEKLSDFSGL